MWARLLSFVLCTSFLVCTSTSVIAGALSESRQKDQFRILRLDDVPFATTQDDSAENEIALLSSVAVKDGDALGASRIPTELVLLDDAILPLSATTDCKVNDFDPLEFRAKWDNGLWFETNDGQFKANIGGRVEQDWIWNYTDRALESRIGRFEDGTFFRRARIHGAGTLYGLIDFFVEFEAAPVDNIVFQDMWAQIADLPWLGTVRAGHIKVPFGLENVTSAKYVTFMERSAVHDAFLQEYDPGIMAMNHGLDQQVTWSYGLLRFDPDESGRAFGNGLYSVAGRVTGLLWESEDGDIGHIGVGYRYNSGGQFQDALGFDTFRFRARPEFRNTPRFVDTGNIVGDNARFWLAEAAVVKGSLMLHGEYVHTTVQNGTLLGGPPHGDPTFDGLFLSASYMLTGESRPYNKSQGAFGRLTPRTNVKLKSNNCAFLQGAWELTYRYSHVNLNSAGIEGGVLDTFTTGLTWYLNRNSKLYLNYILARPEFQNERTTSHLFGTRFHVTY